jgi:hypothetical protein
VQGFDVMMVRAMGVWSFVRMFLFKFSNKDFHEGCGCLLLMGVIVELGGWWRIRSCA